MNFRLFVLAILLCIGHPEILAQKLMDRSGTISFFSEAPLENISATNHQVLAGVDLQKGTVAVAVLMKAFRFERALMEEHFNENYVESDQFPKATFKGKIAEGELLQSQKKPFTLTVSGEIDIHGVTRPIETKVLFEPSESGLKATTTFPLILADFDIKIPMAVIQNISETIEVKASFVLK